VAWCCVALAVVDAAAILVAVVVAVVVVVYRTGWSSTPAALPSCASLKTQNHRPENYRPTKIVLYIKNGLVNRICIQLGRLSEHT
jgi:hypothetical protein